ncbi:MAG TPA: hypothetical protein VJQ82_14365 [Terriglobales bacterium]|nr:hypothetical protein [Terriglobales bacterium]
MEGLLLGLFVVAASWSLAATIPNSWLDSKALSYALITLAVFGYTLFHFRAAWDQRGFWVLFLQLLAVHVVVVSAAMLWIPQRNPPASWFTGPAAVAETILIRKLLAQFDPRTTTPMQR